MLRHAAVSVVRKRSTLQLRRFAAAGSSSAQKRALNKQQIAPASVSPPPAAAGKASSPPPATPPSSGGEFALPAIGLAVIIAGGAYYFDVFGLRKEGTLTTTTKSITETGNQPVKEDPVYQVKEKTLEEENNENVEPMESSEPTVTLESTPDSGNRVVMIDVPKVVSRDIPPVRVIEHPASGNRVEVDTNKTRTAVLPNATDAAKELRNSEESAAALQQAYKALRVNQDRTLFDDLDRLTPSELKIRIVQLAAEMKDQTKWEAVRLQEHLARKEKELADKYMEVMQKQRIELEDILAKKLREQQDTMERQANAIIQQKDFNIQALVKEATDSIHTQYQSAFETVEERLKTEFDADNQKSYLGKLDDEKAKFVLDLNQKVSQIQQLSDKLQQLESALSVSRSFEKGSLHAHQLSAAALALAEKLETSKAAQEEVETLLSAAEKDSVIALALKTIPGSIKSGIPTVSELQTKFDKVQKKSRQAAMVPEGRLGLEGQLLGILFSSLKYAPNPDDAAPEEIKDDPEYILARARRYVQLGELEQAVEQLDKLEGQAAFTVQDWTKSARDRVATDKALHVVKLECAVMNKSMSSAGVSS